MQLLWMTGASFVSGSLSFGKLGLGMDTARLVVGAASIYRALSSAQSMCPESLLQGSANDSPVSYAGLFFHNRRLLREAQDLRQCSESLRLGTAGAGALLSASCFLTDCLTNLV